jgi:hypothetical protein
MQSVINNLGLRLSRKQKILELRPRDGMLKVHKPQVFDYYLISVTVMRLDQRRLLIPLLRMLQLQTMYTYYYIILHTEVPSPSPKAQIMK